MTIEEALKFVADWARCRSWCESRISRIQTQVRLDYGVGKFHTETTLREMMRGVNR